MSSDQIVTAAQLDLLQALLAGPQRFEASEDVIEIVMLGLTRETASGWEIT